jgi:hypothetical protein
MSEQTNSMSNARRRDRWLRIASRVSGATAVVLGGWSLWLAFSTVQQQDQLEAIDSRQDDTVVAPAVLAEVLPPTPRRSAIQITGISEVDDSAEIEHAEFISDSDEADPVTMASFTTESAAGQEPPAADAESTASAAWLTGEIEESVGDDESLPRAVADIPSWKRTTKSLQATKRLPPSISR